MDALELAVVVPTFNERENALELARRLETVLAGTPYEIIFVDAIRASAFFIACAAAVCRRRASKG